MPWSGAEDLGDSSQGRVLEGQPPKGQAEWGLGGVHSASLGPCQPLGF